MKFIINTSILISALLKDSTTRRILLTSNIEFYLPEYSLDEIKKHNKMICERGGLSEGEVNIILAILSSKLTIISGDKIKKYFQDAEKIIGNIDKKDIPFIALALSISNDGIWTNDKHFEKQNRIKVWKTEDLINTLQL